MATPPTSTANQSVARRSKMVTATAVAASTPRQVSSAVMVSSVLPKPPGMKLW